jgi:uncharacterized protein (TIGR02284 family)
MQKDNGKLIDALNSLITINNDRFEGYTTAAKESKDVELDNLFYASANKSKGYAGKLSQYVRELGGEPSEGTKTTGKLYRIWMDVKAAIATNDRLAVLSSCEFGEDEAIKEYASIREDADLNMPSDYMSTIQFQETEIRQDHDEIKQLRDREKSAKAV